MPGGATLPRGLEGGVCFQWAVLSLRVLGLRPICFDALAFRGCLRPSLPPSGPLAVDPSPEPPLCFVPALMTTASPTPCTESNAQRWQPNRAVLNSKPTTLAVHQRQNLPTCRLLFAPCTARSSGALSLL